MCWIFEYPLLYPLQAGNAFYKVFHPFCALFAHGLRYVSVVIQRKCRRMMPEILLYCFGIVPRL
jgi:hypothetical protein